MSEDSGASQVVCSVKAREARRENFRRVGKRLGKKHTRSKDYYTSAEKPIKKALEEYGFVEGFHYSHNVRIQTTSPKGRRTYFWADFVIPKWDMVIECSPAMWHKLDNRVESDRRKRDTVLSRGWNYAVFNGEDIERLKEEDFDHVLLEVLARDGQNFRRTETR